MRNNTRSSVAVATAAAADPPRRPASTAAVSRGPGSAATLRPARPRPTAAPPRPRPTSLGDNEMLAELAMRPRDHVHRDELTHARRRLGTRLRRRLDRTDIAVDDHGHQPVA